MVNEIWFGDDRVLKVLLFTASLGDGHNQVASALRDEFVSRGVQVIEVDYFRAKHLRTARFLERSYEWITHYVPYIYGGAYKITSNFRSQHPLWKFASVLSKKAVLTALHEYDPDIVLQIFPDHALASLTKGRVRKPYIGVVLTDYSMHGHWFHENVDTYFLPHEDLIAPAKSFLTMRSEIAISGIPIRSQFYRKYHLKPIPSKQTPYILVATGGRGVFPNLKDVILKTHKGFRNYSIYVMCGRNKLMLDKVKKLSITVPNLYALPFVENVADWLRDASFAVIKSGGITVSECLACACPMIIFHPQPGQEKNNAIFMERMGAAKIARNLNEFDNALEIMQSPVQRKKMSATCTSLAHPNAAIHIVEHILART